MNHNVLKAAAISISLSLALMAGLSSMLANHSDIPNENIDDARQNLTQVDRVIGNTGDYGNNNAPGQADTANPPRNRRYVPLKWDADSATLALNQGQSGLWGTCGECAIASTLNMATDSEYTESDIVDYALEHNYCDPSNGGMTLDDMAYTYVHFLPEDLDVFGYGGSYAPTIDEMAQKIEDGMLLNVSVYGEMMREGGHTGEGEIYGTHWLVLHSVERDENGELRGFGIVDSASSARYISAQDLEDIYYGHDGTEIEDPSCIEIFGWEYAEWGDERTIRN